MKSEKRTLILTTLVCLLPMLIGLAVYNRMPERMVIHWGINGEPDGWSDRAFAVIWLPCIVAICNFLVHFICARKLSNINSVLRAVLLWLPAAVSVLAGGITLAYGLGYNMRAELITPIFTGLLFIIIGNYMPKTKQNNYVGVRLPWTLNSEENWNRTHRITGFLMVISGFVFILISFIGWNLPVFVGLFTAVILVPIVYSFNLHRSGI